MTIINPLPFNLQNGTTADATQVMADFNEIFNDVNNNAAHNGANSDITTLTGLSTPLSVAQGGTGVINGLFGAKVASNTVATVATLDILISSYSAYRGVRILLTGLQPVNNAVDLWIRLSKDGVSYDSGAANYAWANIVAGGSASDTKITMAASLPNAAASSFNGWIDVYNQAVATFDPVVSFHGTVGLAAAPAVIGGGLRLTAQVTQGVRFMYSAGNIAAASYAVYGIN